MCVCVMILVLCVWNMEYVHVCMRERRIVMGDDGELLYDDSGLVGGHNVR